jgi:hypothetical protein
VGASQSELVAQPTQKPYRQTFQTGEDAQSALLRHSAQTPSLQNGFAPEQAAQAPPTGPQCAASMGWQIPSCRQPSQVALQVPSELQTCEPQVYGVQAMHCHWPVLQMGVGAAQSELVAQPTQKP